jgi:hypothetical protein
VFEVSQYLLLGYNLIGVTFTSVRWGRSDSVTFRTYGFVIPTNLVHRIPVNVVVALGYVNVFLREWLCGVLKILSPILTLKSGVCVKLCLNFWFIGGYFFQGIVGHGGEAGVLIGVVSLGLKTL